MNELYKLGISDNTIKSMLNINNELKDMSTKDILEKEIILENINCSNIQIRNIISSNPIFLSRTNEDIINLINYLEKIGFNNINVLFDSNPYILSLEIYEINNYIESKKNSGQSLSDIIDDMYSNPILFNEI